MIYVQRRTPFERPVSWRIEGGALVREGRTTRRFDLTQLRLARLSRGANRYAPDAVILSLTFRRGAVSFGSYGFKDRFSWTDQTATFAPFARALLGTAATASRGARFETGSSRVAGIFVGAAAILAVGVALVLLATLTAGAMTLGLELGARLSFVLILMLAVWPWIGSAGVRRFEPGAPPPELLPRSSRHNFSQITARPDARHGTTEGKVLSQSMTRRDGLTGIAAWLAATPAVAQDLAKPPPPPPNFEAMNAAMRMVSLEGRYVPLFKFVSTPPGDEQMASFVGVEAIALAKAASTATAPDLTGATAQDAIEAIVAAAKGKRVVMLNEAHVSSRHRNFLARVARALRPEGFTHLAAETFTNDDPTPPIESFGPGKPFNATYGTYTLDPVFAEAIREARDLGYQFAAYEQKPSQTDPAKFADIPMREQAQAENVAALLKRYPEGRFLIHVGYSHLREIPTAAGVKWFAARLKDETGVDAMTIAQAYTGSFGPHAPDGPGTRDILAKFSPRNPIVARLETGRVLFATNDGNDLAVIHPLLQDVEGRPGWLASDPARRRVSARLDAPSPQGYVLAHATHAEDPVQNTVPADLYPLKAGSLDLVFFLRPGRYRLRVETEAGFTPVGEVTV